MVDPIFGQETLAGEQKYFIYFHSPVDVAGTTFMVYKYPNRDDDRWLFIPAINLVNRIAARDSRSRFVGSDFTYEDISGRDLEADTHALLKDEESNGHKVYVVESKPNSPAEYARKLAWIDQATFLPLKEEYYDIQGALYKIFTADEIKEVQSSALGGSGGEFTAGIQYYAEYLLDYSSYRVTLLSGFPAQDRLRQILTVRLTQLLRYQTLRLSLFTFYSPTDEDYYFIPEVRYSFTDALWGTVGANIFGGKEETTFFGQLDKNDNLYVTVRYEF